MDGTTDDQMAWKDFPKGLRVLLLDEDTDSAAEIKSRLEKMDYIVFTFSNENEALTAISNKTECFHVAIVEVSTGNNHGSFRFLESAKDLPTIMTSNIQCLSTMMKCIALGAVEFLQKPLSEDKLKNIWQHVVHKVLNAGGADISRSLQPIKDTIVSRLQLQVETMNPDGENTLEMENEVQDHKHSHEYSAASDRFPAPSTPQLKQGGRLVDDGDCQDQANSAMEKESADQEAESKSVDITYSNPSEETTIKVDPAISAKGAGIIEEDNSPDSSKTGNNKSSHQNDRDRIADSGVEGKTSNRPSCGARVNKRKIKVDWTPELHKRFVQAVEQLGVDQAIPSRILELMKTDGLTRHNVASHLQKYRMHRRHIMPKEDGRKWHHHPRDSMQRVYAQNPVMAFPPYHANHGFSTSQMYPVWGHPSSHPPGIQMWGHPGYPSWQPSEIWPWKTYAGMHADAWGCPVMPTPQIPSSTSPQGDEEIDRVMKEAINKPWLPLPLGLKSPSTESVLSELHRQGISAIPPHTSTNINSWN